MSQQSGWVLNRARSRANAMHVVGKWVEGVVKASAVRCVQRVMRICEGGSGQVCTVISESLVAC